MGKNTIVKDTLILLAITLIAGLLLGAVYGVTEGPIAEQALKAKTEAYSLVYPGGDISDEAANAELAKALEAFAADDSDAKITEALSVNGGEGYVMSCQANGYGVPVKFAVGIIIDGDNLVIKGLSVLEAANETPGLGAKITDDTQPVRTQFADLSVAAGDKLAVAKDGGTMDQIGGATLTSRACMRAVNAALKFAAENK